MYWNKKNFGFTLIELMVTIAVLVIVLGISVPEFSKMVAENKVRTVASDIHSNLLTARSTAISMNIAIILSPISSNWINGWELYPETDKDIEPDKRKILLAHGSTDAVQVTSNPNGNVLFNANGRTNSNTKFTIASSAYSSVIRCVTIEASGRAVTTVGACP